MKPARYSQLRRPPLLCADKRRHPDEVAARAHGMRSIENNKNAEMLFVYRCEHCAGWHLTKSPLGKSPAITSENPVDIDPRAELLDILREGPITTDVDIQTPEMKWAYLMCKNLESDGLVKREWIGTGLIKWTLIDVVTP